MRQNRTAPDHSSSAQQATSAISSNQSSNFHQPQSFPVSFHAQFEIVPLTDETLSEERKEFYGDDDEGSMIAAAEGRDQHADQQQEALTQEEGENPDTTEAVAVERDQDDQIIHAIDPQPVDANAVVAVSESSRSVNFSCAPLTVFLCLLVVVFFLACGSFTFFIYTILALVRTTNNEQKDACHSSHAWIYVLLHFILILCLCRGEGCDDSNDKSIRSAISRCRRWMCFSESCLLISRVTIFLGLVGWGMYELWFVSCVTALRGRWLYIIMYVYVLLDILIIAIFVGAFCLSICYVCRYHLRSSTRTAVAVEDDTATGTMRVEDEEAAERGANDEDGSGQRTTTRTLRRSMFSVPFGDNSHHGSQVSPSSVNRNNVDYPQHRHSFGSSSRVDDLDHSVIVIDV